MLTILNGHDKPIEVSIDGKKTIINTGLQPLIISELSKLKIADINIPLTGGFSQIIYCKQDKKGIMIAGTLFMPGEKVSSNILYVTKKGFFASDDRGELNNYSFSSDTKKMLAVVSSCKTNIRVGKFKLAPVVLKCNDYMLIDNNQSEIYIEQGGKEMGINVGQIKMNYPSITKIVVCDDATKTTYTTCDGKYDTQDLSVLYITLAGKIYYGGKCVYSPFSFAVLLIIFALVIAVVLMLVGGILFMKKQNSSS